MIIISRFCHTCSNTNSFLRKKMVRNQEQLSFPKLRFALTYQRFIFWRYSNIRCVHVVQPLQNPMTPWRRHASWWRHQMETFSALLVLSAGNSPVSGEFPTQRPVTRSFDVFFDQRVNKWLSKQSWGWWFETPPSSFWRHYNVST